MFEQRLRRSYRFTYSFILSSQHLFNKYLLVPKIFEKQLEMLRLYGGEGFLILQSSPCNEESKPRGVNLVCDTEEVGWGDTLTCFGKDISQGETGGLDFHR